MESPLKIYPTVEQCQIINKISCSVEECGQNFTSESNLNLHITKSHQKSDLKPLDVEKQYFCPGASCPWSSSKCFKNMKSLRQHFLKVHTEKSFNCVLCQKSFASRTFLKTHSDFCGIIFKCLDCNSSYACYDTLKTHSRRKKHRIMDKRLYKEDVELKTVKIEEHVLEFCPNEVLNSDQDSQTLTEKPLLKSKMTQVTHDADFLVSQNTQHTQTGSKNVVHSVETQTIWESPNMPPKSEVYDESLNPLKHINTQTDVIESRESSCNTSFNIEDFSFTFSRDIERNSSSTQTSLHDQDIFSISTSTHDSIHTDTSDLLTDTLSNFDAHFFNCHMETQTDFMFQDDIFNSDYYSNMYTQTCDDILNGFSGFSDIQTQTGFNSDMLRSVESQTLMSSSEKVGLMKGFAHTETQTDAEFRQMLEIINS